jgi:hypothetical protein
MPAALFELLFIPFSAQRNQAMSYEIPQFSPRPFHGSSIYAGTMSPTDMRWFACRILD